MKNDDIPGSYIDNKYKPREYDKMDYSDVTCKVLRRYKSPG